MLIKQPGKTRLTSFDGKYQVWQLLSTVRYLHCWKSQKHDLQANDSVIAFFQILYVKLKFLGYIEIENR